MLLRSTFFLNASLGSIHFCFSMYNRIGEFFLAYSFDYAGTLLCFYRCSPLIVLVLSLELTDFLLCFN